MMAISGRTPRTGMWSEATRPRRSSRSVLSRVIRLGRQLAAVNGEPRGIAGLASEQVRCARIVAMRPESFARWSPETPRKHTDFTVRLGTEADVEACVQLVVAIGAGE